MGCGAEIEANTVMTALLAGVSFDIPTVDLDDPEFEIPAGGAIVLPALLTNDDLTTKTVDGTGTFDVLMSSVAAHLKGEFDAGRITGAEYSKVYLQALESSMANAVQYLLQKDASYWAGVRAQYEAKIAEARLVQARVELVTAKVQLAAVQYTARTQEATYALTKMKLATESVTYCIAQYNLTEMLPAQKWALEEQIEANRAQTTDTRADGITPITGLIGKQKDLYSQQITSYQRDGEIKMTKLFTDAWITMKTIDEGLLPPTEFQNASLDAILGDLKVNFSLG
jgi:hypothetical protein